MYSIDSIPAWGLLCLSILNDQCACHLHHFPVLQGCSPLSGWSKLLSSSRLHKLKQDWYCSSQEMGIGCYRDPPVDQWTKTGRALHYSPDLLQVMIQILCLQQNKDASTSLQSPGLSKLALLPFLHLGQEHNQEWQGTCKCGTGTDHPEPSPKEADCAQAYGTGCWSVPHTVYLAGATLYGRDHRGSPWPAFESLALLLSMSFSLSPLQELWVTGIKYVNMLTDRHWICAHANYETALTIQTQHISIHFGE